MNLDTLFVAQLHETARVHCFVGASMDPAGAQIPGPAPWAGPATRDGGGDPDRRPTHENRDISGRCLQGPFSALRNSYAMEFQPVSCQA